MCQLKFTHHKVCVIKSYDYSIVKEFISKIMKEQDMSDFKVEGVEINDVIKRRIRFLLDAAKNELKKDQEVTYAMRVLSNHATIGKNAGSAEIKKQNKKVSKKASQLLYSADLATYCQNTINEHPKPILLTWDWLKEHAYTLSIEEVWNEFSNNTMVTVTKDEDNYIKTKGLNSIGDMQSRYTDLGITIVTLSETPRDYHKKLKQKN